MKIQNILTTTIALLLTSTILRAQTWDGGGADNNFNTALNWNANLVPVNNGTANLIFAGAVDPTPVVNVNFDVSGVTFSNTAGAFNISPGVSTALTIRGGGITNNDADTQTFSTPVTFAAGSSITATSGPLNFTGLVSPGGNTVTVGGGFNTNLDAIVGTGTFVKNGTGILSVAPVGNQNYSLTLNAGTVNYTTSVTFVGGVADISVAGGTFAPLSNLTVSSGATFDVAGTGTFIFPASRTMTVQASSTATYANFLTTAASSIYRVTGASSTFSTGGLAVRDGASVEVLSGGAFTNTTGLIDFGAGGTAGTILVDGTGSVFTHTPSQAATLGFGAGSTGTLTFNNGGTGSFANSSLVFGTGGGNGAMTVKNGAQVTAGTFEVAQTTLSGTGTVLVTGPGSKLTTTFNISDFSIGATSGGTGTGTVTVADGGELDLAGPLTVNETGTLNLDGGIITMALTEAFTNNGTLNFNAGRISLGDNLNIGGGTSPLGTNITLQTGKEIVVPSSRTTTIGTASAVVLDGGLLSTGTLVNSGGTIDFRRGTLRLTGSSGLTIGSGGPLGANVSLPAGSTLELTAVAATVAVSNGASLAVDGGSLSTRLLVVNGTVLINAGTANASDGGSIASGGQLFVARDLTLGGIFTNNSGGRIELANDTGRISGGATISNSGLLTGSGTIATPLINNASGRIRVDTGKSLIVTAGFLGNSGEINLQGGTLDFSGAITNGAAGFIAGRGALYTGGLTNNGQMAFSGGTMDIHGDITNAAGARITTSGGATTTFFDDVVHNGTEIRTSAGSASVFFGAVSGAGPFTGTGTVYFEGDLRPGNSPASVLYEGDLVFGDGSSLTLEIGGLNLGSQYDHLNIGGALHADGDLVLALLDGFVPQFGDTFDLLDVGTFAGDFDSITAPALSDGNAWDFSALKTTGSVTVVPEPGVGALLLSALGFLGMRRARLRVARSSRALVSASRRNELPCAPDTENVFAKGAVSKVREGGTPSPTLGTSVLPGICRDALSR